MKMDTLKFSKLKGWSKSIDPSFNSANTLALVFCDAESFLQSKVSSIFSETQLLGCSSAGNILNYDICDSDLTVGLIQFQKTRLKLQSFQIEEVAAVHENLPKESHLLGFYSYGEISPTQKGTSCALHNQSMTLTVFDEK